MNYKKILDDAGTVAHYSKLKHVANILKDQKLLLSPVENLADPREIPDKWIKTEGDRKRHEAFWQSAEKIRSGAKHQIRLLSTIGPKENHDPGASLIEESNYCRPRMWAQYGEQSKGFCIVLDRKLLHNEVKNVAQKTTGHMMSGKVDYFDWLHRVNGGADIEYGPDNDPAKFDIFEILNKNDNLNSIYFKKSDDWKMEHEYRWLLYDPKLDPIYVPIGTEGVVKAVVLGINFPNNQISQVQLYCKDLNCRLFELSYRHPEYQLTELRVECPC